jgi:hypothetical protein
MDPWIKSLERQTSSRIRFIRKGRNSKLGRMTSVATENSVFYLVKGERQASDVVRKPNQKVFIKYIKRF